MLEATACYYQTTMDFCSKNALSSIEHALNELNNPVVSCKMGQNSYNLFLDSFTDELMFQKLDKFYSKFFAALAK